MTENEYIKAHIEENNKRIENIKFFMSSNHDANIDDCKRNIEILAMSNNALEKQIPKKVIKLANGTEHCPTCDCDNSCIGYGVCIDCGQKLDWSDTD